MPLAEIVSIRASPGFARVEWQIRRPIRPSDGSSCRLKYLIQSRAHQSLIRDLNITYEFIVAALN